MCTQTIRSNYLLKPLARGSRPHMPLICASKPFEFQNIRADGGCGMTDVFVSYKAEDRARSRPSCAPSKLKACRSGGTHTSAAAMSGGRPSFAISRRPSASWSCGASVRSDPDGNFVRDHKKLPGRSSGKHIFRCGSTRSIRRLGSAEKCRRSISPPGKATGPTRDMGRCLRHYDPAFGSTEEGANVCVGRRRH